MTPQEGVQLFRDIIRAAVPVGLLFFYLYLVIQGQVEVQSFVDWALPVIISLFAVDGLTRLVRPNSNTGEG